MTWGQDKYCVLFIASFGIKTIRDYRKKISKKCLILEARFAGEEGGGSCAFVAPFGIKSTIDYQLKKLEKCLIL